MSKMWGIPVMFDDFQHVNIWHFGCLTWTARFYIDVDQDLSGTISMDEYINYAASLNHGWHRARFPRGCSRKRRWTTRKKGTQKDPKRQAQIARVVGNKKWSTTSGQRELMSNSGKKQRRKQTVGAKRWEPENCLPNGMDFAGPA